MSEMTLICCFIGMMGFPTQTVYMVGVGCTQFASRLRWSST